MVEIFYVGLGNGVGVEFFMGFFLGRRGLVILSFFVFNFLIWCCRGFELK